MTEKGKRIEKIMRHYGLNKNTLSKAINKPNATIGQILNSDREPIDATLEIILSRFPEINRDWLMLGEGKMLKSQSIHNSGTINAQNGVVGQVHGDFHSNGSKDQVIEKQEQQVLHMFEAFMSELRGFHEYTQRQDDHLDNIVKKSYLRNERNMERIDKIVEQQNDLIRMVIEQNQRTQDRADRLLDMLEKNLKP